MSRPPRAAKSVALRALQEVDNDFECPPPLMERIAIRQGVVSQTFNHLPDVEFSQSRTDCLQNKDLSLKQIHHPPAVEFSLSPTDCLQNKDLYLNQTHHLPD